jgi:thiamine-monophosphate kinase
MPSPGEFEIIERWFTRAVTDPAVLTGIGDDAAIVRPDGPLAVAVDMLVAGIHFPPELPAGAIGHRALAVNLSDLAAVGATPRWATLALSLPAADPDWLEAFAAGFFTLAERWRLSLIGGDTTRGPLTITVQVIGASAPRPLLRSGGRPGDCVVVSGTLGDSAAAIELLAAASSEPTAAARTLIERFSYPEPRIALGQALAGIAHAAIDISDGLLADLGHICRLSGCGAELDIAALPLSPALLEVFPRERAEDFALAGGDDYELCFTCAEAELAAVQAAAVAAGTRITVIGRLTAEPGLRARHDGRDLTLEPAGYTHF